MSEVSGNAYLTTLQESASRDDLLREIERHLEEKATMRAAHDARVTELLDANGRDVERRRAAERTASVLVPKIGANGIAGFNGFAAMVHHLNHKWWHDQDGSPLERNKGELLCLIHSEISEAMEGERKSLQDDKLTHRPMAEVELADALIRICDYAAGFGYDLDGAVMEKLAFNQQRADHQYEARAATNGKKW